MPLAPIDDEAKVPPGRPVRKSSVRRARGTDVGFAGYETQTFTAGIMQRLDAIQGAVPAEESPVEMEPLEEDYFNFYDRDSAPGAPVEETLQVAELKRVLDEEVAHQMEGIEGQVEESVWDGEGKGKGKEGVLAPNVDQEKVEGEWFDGIDAEEG
jgi:hypothetical protein